MERNIKIHTSTGNNADQCGEKPMSIEPRRVQQPHGNRPIHGGTNGTGGGKGEVQLPDVPGTAVAEVLPSAVNQSGIDTTHLLLDLIKRSQLLLKAHPINLNRKSLGKDMANSIWPWSPGYKPDMKTLKEMFGIESGAVISAVDLIQGIGVYAGLDVVKVDGATGLYDTNYEGKAMAALEALKQSDFVYLHIEASDEAGHEGDYALKQKTIEYLDNRVVKFLVEAIAKMDEPVAIAILPDHPTPWKLKTHTREAVPFLIWYPGIVADEVQRYDEKAAEKGNLGTMNSLQFMPLFLQKRNGMME